MSLLPQQDVNYRLLRSLVSGNGVSVNVQCLSERLKRHRNTVDERVHELFEKQVVNHPIFPFVGLYKEYPLLVLTWIDLPYDERVQKWLEDDPFIFSAYRSRYQEYNALLMTYHKDITSYQLWREQTVAERKIPLVDDAFPRSSTSFCSSQLMIKSDPGASIRLIEEDLREKERVRLNGYEMDKLAFDILKLLVTGRCIKLNESRLSKELGIHRKTILRRIQELVKERWLSSPVCRFPNFFTPPGYILAICKLEIRSAKQEFIQQVRSDPHIAMAFDIKEGGYDFLLFCAFRDLTDELEWEVKAGLYLPRSIGKVDIHFFSPERIVTLSERKISLGMVDAKHLYFRT